MKQAVIHYRQWSQFAQIKGALTSAKFMTVTWEIVFGNPFKIRRETDYRER